MAQTNLNIRIDENLKQEFDKMCNELGMTMTKTVVRQRGIPFPVSLDTPNAATLAAIDDVNLRRELRGPFESVQLLMDDLNPDD